MTVGIALLGGRALGRVAAPVMASEAGGVSPLRRPNPGVAAGLSIIPGLGQLYSLVPAQGPVLLPALDPVHDRSRRSC